jgi:cytochrome c biogenesis protein CcmG/thiol:disulfide interchange protein DsbE
VNWRALIVAVAPAAVLAGCGTAAHNAAPPAATVTAAFRGSPPPLAALHSQANELLSGGPQAFEARLATLRGYPVVVNLWASWCGPCQSEFPTYQKVAVSLGKRVAFIGIDARDANDAATKFLHRFPVTYPSYTDPTAQIGSKIQAYASFYPQTVYFNKRGTIVYDKAGPYLSVAELRKDIRFYLHVE